jgi:hypothetical protein
MTHNILFLAYEISFHLLLITSIKILLLLLYISWVFLYTTKNLKYVVDRGILWKLEAALGQQKSAQVWCKGLMLQTENTNWERELQA